MSSFYVFLCKGKNSEYAIKMLILIKESWSKRLNSFTHFKFVHFWNITPEHFSLRNSQAMSFWFSCILVWNVFLPTQQLAFSQQRKFRDGGRSEKIEGGAPLPLRFHQPWYSRKLFQFRHGKYFSKTKVEKFQATKTLVFPSHLPTRSAGSDIREKLF